MFVAHFGNGDEADQDLILRFFEELKINLEQITIIPGTGFGHLELANSADSEIVMNNLECRNATFYGETVNNYQRVLCFFNTPLRKDQLKKKTILDFPEA